MAILLLSLLTSSNFVDQLFSRWYNCAAYFGVTLRVLLETGERAGFEYPVPTHHTIYKG